MSTKMYVFRASVISTLLYGCETWTTTFQTRRKLRGFIMMCLPVISRVTRWQQQLWHLHNDVLRAWLGVPDIVALITQSQLRWLGHVARMPVNRLPRRILSAFLPDSVGTQRPPGRLKGKWYRQTLIEALRTGDIAMNAWMQLAAQNQGRDWKLSTRRVAVWFKPHRPKQGIEPPCRDRETKSILGPSPAVVDKSFAAAVVRAQNWINDQDTPAAGFFKLESPVSGCVCSKSCVVVWG